MNRDELQDRIEKADERLVMMAKKYPVLLSLLIAVPLIVGVVIGKWAM